MLFLSIIIFLIDVGKLSICKLKYLFNFNLTIELGNVLIMCKLLQSNFKYLILECNMI